MPKSKDAKRIVITGVSRGLGRALAQEFVRRGHRVHGCARSQRHLADLGAELGGSKVARLAQVDVVDDAAVAAWAAEVLVEGPPDLLLNNAAIMNRGAPLWEVTAEEFSRIVDVNVKGVHNVLRHFVPAMIERGEGVIVNFSSGWGRSASPDVGPYCATKWAIEGLTRSLSMELPHGVAAIPLNPGVIHTEMLESCFGRAASGYPSPAAWAAKAAPFLLELSYDDNGDPLTAPGG